MKKNINTTDRFIRILVFIATLILFFTKIITGSLAIALLVVISSILLLTATINFRLLYRLIGVSSCKIKSKK